jgi:hypothetical protein
MQTKQTRQNWSLARGSGLALAICLGLLIGLFFWPQQAVHANGGTILTDGDKGPFNITLVASPSPPTPEVPVHLTLIVTRVNSNKPVNDASIIATPSMPGMAMPGVEPKRFLQTVARPNIYDVDIPVGMEGLWNMNLQIISPELGQTTFDVSFKVEKPAAPWGVIIGILVALPLLAGVTWWFLFRGQSSEEEEDA